MMTRCPGPSKNVVETVKSCDKLDKADPAWMTAFYAFGVLYTFLAIAIASNELFIPALEEIANSRHLNLSMDVAGATLMEAGGSAPEFYSSLFRNVHTKRNWIRDHHRKCCLQCVVCHYHVHNPNERSINVDLVAFVPGRSVLCHWTRCAHRIYRIQLQEQIELHDVEECRHL